MDIIEAIKTRKSIRDFKPDSVPKEILKEILTVSTRSPSAMNTQPWEFIVITGDTLDKIRDGNVKEVNAGKEPNPELTFVRWPSDSIYRTRQVDLAKELFKLMDIKRDDKQKRLEWMNLGFRYFNAPAAVILTVDRCLHEVESSIDVGLVVQSICLAALKYGLGTCIANQGVMYPDVLRKFVDIPESKRLMVSIAIGYPNPDFPANRLETTREPLENIITWS